MLGVWRTPDEPRPAHALHSVSDGAGQRRWNRYVGHVAEERSGRTDGRVGATG